MGERVQVRQQGLPGVVGNQGRAFLIRVNVFDEMKGRRRLVNLWSNEGREIMVVNPVALKESGRSLP